MATSEGATNTEPLFDNPFTIEDLQVFDDDSLRRILFTNGFGVTTKQLAHSLHHASHPVVQRIEACIPNDQRAAFRRELDAPLSEEQITMARKYVLDNLFWELTYWKTPDFYEELIEGEWLHSGIFQRLASELQDKVVLDVGAGSGRATFQCLRYGAKMVYAVEPSPGLLRILKRKSSQSCVTRHITPLEGRFDAVPLPDNSVDVALSCSAFTALPEQGGERGLVELQRVAKPNGKIVLIWPRCEDRDWLEAHGFSYVSLPMQQEMSVHFRSLHTALECARRFYAHNQAVLHYLHSQQKADVPFSVIGMNPPHEYCWRNVEK